jgi:transcriptional regulator with XRE-family HTH domain
MPVVKTKVVGTGPRVVSGPHFGVVDRALLDVSLMRDALRSDEMPRSLAANLQRLIGNATQQEIANKVGMSRSALNAILQGRVDPRLSTVQALADVLGTPMCELTGGVAETAGLSRDARRLALLYDGLDPGERAFVWTFLRKLYGEPPSLP